MNTELIVFVVYIIFVICIGIYFFIKGQNASDKDYFLGGRKMGAWVTALSAGASGCIFGLLGACFVLDILYGCDRGVHDAAI